MGVKVQVRECFSASLLVYLPNFREFTVAVKSTLLLFQIKAKKSHKTGSFHMLFAPGMKRPSTSQSEVFRPEYTLSKNGKISQVVQTIPCRKQCCLEEYRISFVQKLGEEEMKT